MKLILIRHGLSKSNRDKIISGSLDTPLSLEGKQILLEFRDKITYPKTDIYVASPLSRCISTFEVLFPKETLEFVVPNLKEMCFGDMEGKSFSEVELDDFFIALFENKKICNAELLSDFINRVENGFIDICNYLKENNYSTATVVCHSTVIKSIFCKLNNISAKKSREIRIENGKGYSLELEVENNRIKYGSIIKLGEL
ncbi:MAG: histidine phosphatase family protein [Lachnospirales bacterium]